MAVGGPGMSGKSKQKRPAAATVRRRAAAAAALVVLLAATVADAAGPRQAPGPSPSQCLNSAPCSLTCAGTAGCAAGARVTRSAAVVTEAGVPGGGGGEAPGTMGELIQAVTAVAEAKANATTAALAPGSYPAATTASGAWETVPAGHWVSGFFPGVLWQLHALTGDDAWAAKAREWQAGLADHQRDWQLQHDFGFVYMPTFAHSYGVTKDPEDLRQALLAAEALAWSYNPVTRSLRTFEGWRPPGATGRFQQLVIIDFMMNVEALTWGAANADPDPAAHRLRFDRAPHKDWVDIAVSHARQVAANHVRPDGSTFHVVEYEPVAGTINKRFTYQGYADSSTWARGQAWAIAGFGQMHAATALPEFLDTAKRVADRWLELLGEQAAGAGTPVEFVPTWDFHAPYDAARDGPRDTSAAAVAALGLLRLAEALGEASDCGRRYLCAAVNTLRALASPKYLSAADERHAALLKHATGNLPAGDKVDVGLAYGDYYYLAALAKCRGMAACASYPTAAAAGGR